MERNQKSAVKANNYTVFKLLVQHFYLSKKAQLLDRDILIMIAKIATI